MTDHREIKLITNRTKPIKTDNAKEVLQLLDSHEDAPDNLCGIVEDVAKKAGISKAQLLKELEPFI